MKKGFSQMLLKVNLLDATLKSADLADEAGIVTAEMNIPIYKDQGMSNNSMELIEPLFEVKESQDYFDIVAKVRIIKNN